MKKNVEAVRGTKDYLPKETIMRDYVKDVIFLHITLCSYGKYFIKKFFV